MGQPAWESWWEELVCKSLALLGSREFSVAFPPSASGFLCPLSGQGSSRLLPCELGKDESPGQTQVPGVTSTISAWIRDQALPSQHLFLLSSQ